MSAKPKLGMDVNFALKMFEEYKQTISRKDALLREVLEITEGYHKVGVPHGICKLST